MAQYDYLVVGAGLFGATFAYLARKAGKRCLVLDKRPHVGGNLYCSEVQGIHVHQYGPHIFHTSNEKVWNFVNSLVPFNRFTYCPLADFEGERYNLPFNMNTFYQMWGCTTPEQARCIIEEQRKAAVLAMQEQGVASPRNLEEQALCLVGRDIYEKLIKGYTEKQWGRPCSELPAFIIRRLPVRFVFDNNYFNDPWQGIPIGGYNKLVEKLLEGVECRLNVDFLENREHWTNLAERIVYTGPIDAYYQYCYGPLEYRTLRFEQELLPVANFQGCAAVNYTSAEVPYTRIIEHKHFEQFGDAVEAVPATVITREYPAEWTPGCEPFYPVNDDRNSALFARYQELAEQEEKVIFGGRLAEYRYYDMAPVIERAFELAAMNGCGAE